MSINHHKSPSSNENYDQLQSNLENTAVQDTELSLQQHTDHPERMNPGSQRFFGEPRPGDQPDRIDVNPSRKVRKRLLIAGGATLTTLGIGVGMILGRGTEAPSTDELGTLSGDQPVASAPEIPGQVAPQPFETNQQEPAYSYSEDEMNEMAPSSFANLNTITRLDYSVDRLLETREQAYKIIREQGTSAEAEVISDNSTKEQIILNNFAADMLSASAQGKDLASVDKGMKLLSAVISPDNPNFNSVLSKIGDDEKIIGVYQANNQFRYRTIENAQFMDREIGPNGAEVIRVTDVTSGEETVMLFEREFDSKGNEAYIYTGNYNIYEAPQLDYQLQQYRIKE